jgi:hypothetical protein
VEDQDVHQQLDTLESIIRQTDSPDDSSLKPHIILSHINYMIERLDPNSDERHALFSRYNQLKAEWELLSKRREESYQSKKLKDIDQAALALKDVTPKNKDTGSPLHPLDGSQDSIDEFGRSLSFVRKLIDAFQMNDDDETYAHLVSDLRDKQNEFELFKRGVTFGQITTAICDELDAIQQLMMDSESKPVNDSMIQNLEERINVVSGTIQGIREEYTDLLLEDTLADFYQRFIDHIDDIEDRYQVVRDWVDQVRRWFLEAERIRAWIDKHINIIEERNEADMFDPLSREVNMPDATIVRLHEEHEKLKQEIEHFDSDDMTRLRLHVKNLTNATSVDRQDKELSPADTTTIEITLTTLNKLNRLTQLLNERSHLIQLLLLRVKWEHLFGDAVQWIATTDGELDAFLKGKARWSEKDEDYSIHYAEQESGGIEQVIQTLVNLERKIADFDRGTYSDVLDAFQEMEDLKSNALPDYLEMRQSGFEKAFEDLMKRSAFSRKVVEQLLSMISTVEKFKELRDVGEQLRQSMLVDASGQEEGNDDDVQAERVQLFKEESARLITNASTCIPYPAVPEMSTAIGANDVHDNEVTNEAIKSTVSGYSMTLALITDGLDQLLNSRYQIMSLQQRADDAYDAMVRAKSWMDERIKMLSKPRFDIVLYSSDPPKTVGEKNISTTDDEDFLHLDKERDNIASRLQQMEEDELAKLFETVRVLETDVDASNAVTIDRNRLIDGVENLEKSLEQLKDLLSRRHLELDTLKKRIDWENQYSKTNSSVQTIARKMCDFNIKKARYDPVRENAEKPSYAGDSENLQSFQFLQDKVAEMGDRQVISLSSCYQDMVMSYSVLLNGQDASTKNTSAEVESVLPDHISTKQLELKLRYEDLRALSKYTSDLMTQRSTITEFLLRVQDARHEGEKIKDAISKKIRRIMVKDEEGPAFDSRAAKFKDEVEKIWQECGDAMPYPVYNGSWLRSLHPSEAASYRTQVRAQVKTLLDTKMDDLRTLEKSIDQLLESYQNADRMKSLVSQYEEEASQLREWVDEQTSVLKAQHVDVSAENLTLDPDIADLKHFRDDLFSKVEEFENNRVKTLHDKVAQIVQDSIEKKQNQSIDVSTAARRLGEVMEHLLQLKLGLSDQAVTLKAASVRAEWENKLQLGITKLEEMSEQLRQFTIKKNRWITQDNLTESNLVVLENELDQLIDQKDDFLKTILPDIQNSYDALTEYFPQLSRPMATPDHLEAQMESIHRTTTRLQENMSIRSKELDLIKQRLRWEETVKDALDYLLRQEVVLDTFVEEKARWSNKVDPHESDEEKLRTEWATIYQDYESYKERVIHSIQDRYTQIVSENTDNMYNNAGFISESFTKKKHDMDGATDLMEYHLKFSNEIVSQRCLVSAFILRTAQLEQSAELIREEFINTKGSRLLEEHMERLQKFKLGIEDVRDNLAASIPYPVRVLKASDSTKAKQKDETTNSVIRDTIEVRNTQLGEILSSLQQLLESKERVSRRRISIHSYKKQAEVCESWMDTRREVLRKSIPDVEMLEQSLQYNKEVGVDVIEKLKDAVTQADSVEHAMKAPDTVLSSLNTAFEKCKCAFEDKSLDDEELREDDHDQLIEELASTVEPTQKRLSDAWGELLEEANSTNKLRTSLLIESKLQQWISSLNSLLSLVQPCSKQQVKSGETIVADDVLLEWTTRFDQLKNKDYQALSGEVQDCKDLLGQAQTDVIQPLFDQGETTIRDVSGCLDAVQTKKKLERLMQVYNDGIAHLQDLVDTEIKNLKAMQEQFGVVSTESTEARATQHQDFANQYKQLNGRYGDIQDMYEDVNEQRKHIDIDGDEVTTRDAVEGVWSQLNDMMSAISSLLSRTSKWVAYFDRLFVSLTELESVKELLEKGEIANVQLQDASSRLDGIKLAVESQFDAKSLENDDLLDDDTNLEKFEAQRASLATELKDLQQILVEKLEQNEKLELVQFIKDSISDICKLCDAQLQETKDHAGTKLGSIEDAITNEKVESLRSLSDECMHFSNKQRDVLTNCDNNLETLQISQCNALESKFNYSKDDIDQLIQPFTSLTGEIQASIDSEIVSSQLIRKLYQYLLSHKTVLDSARGIKQELLGSVKSMDEFVEMETQIESLEDGVKDLLDLGASITTSLIEKESLQDLSLLVSSTITAKTTSVNDEWDSLKATLADVRSRIENDEKYRRLVSNLEDTIQFANDMKDRINGLQLTGKGVPSEEQELEDITNEISHKLNKKSKERRPLLEVDGLVTEQVETLQSQLEDHVKELYNVLSIKKKEASDEGNIADFISIINQFEEQASLLSSAIENAAPHHSRVIHNKFVKTDLQSLLKSLVASYKLHRQGINSILEKANIESKKQYLDDNGRVSDSLSKATKKWKQLQNRAAARERELQTCISQLDHEFFTKLAVAKTTSQTRKINQAKMMQRRSPLPPLSSRNLHQHTLAPSNKRPSKTPMSASSSSSRLSRVYVPDPKSELDMQLGRIINESPYRLMVKMVPGEVGKYWFGDEKPRLVYCRILPSKLVMVRVGGGWVELSK